MSTTETARAVEQQAAGNSFLVDVWITLKRWLRKAVRNSSVVFEALITPFVFLILFTQVFGQLAGGPIQELFGADVTYVTFLTPSIVILSAMVVATHSGMGLIDDMNSGMFDKILVSPTHRGAMFLGKALADMIRIIIETGMILVLGYVLLWIDSGGSVGTYIQTGLGGVLGVFAIVVVFALWFTAFSNIAALVTQDATSAAIWAYLVQYPLFFASSAFVPISVLPKWMQLVATINPITYGVDAVRALMLGQDVLTVIDVTAFSGIWNTVVPAVIVLGVFNLVFGGIAVFLLRRVASSRVS
ncbi:ABC transporter permease [Natrialba asiatica]|uniref:ABC transporter n=1 Tax=Natrialba asiatica (strain ATCC 700177 / DSM 12278 / JCM 9576 / FERM P-10747 / NBRC 102637 / 172P1) TaxID=29540 RepID=M0AL21_NATA1|nr:ABC transporter permease [Natrialba asiatica]ELY99254.1 ABC transporter [Natrialba asiatica DSM 12278]